MQITNFNYSQSNVTAIARVGQFLWIAFEGSDEECTLYKVSAFNPNQIFYEITVPVTKINRIKPDSNHEYIYLAVDSDNYIGIRYKHGAPLTTYTYIDKPSEISENSVDLEVDTSYVYFLIPGIASGTNTQILKYERTNHTLDDTFDLTTIDNCKTMTMDDNENLWLATYTDPCKLIKVDNTGSYESWTIE